MCLLKIKFIFFLFNLDIVKYFQQMCNLKQISSAHGIFPLFHAEWLGFVSLITISVAMVLYYHGLNNKILNSSILSVIESFHFHRWYFQSYFRCKIKWWKIPTDIHIFCFSYSWLYMCKSWIFYCAWHMLLLIPFSVVIFYLLRLEHSRELISPKKRLFNKALSVSVMAQMMLSLRRVQLPLDLMIFQAEGAPDAVTTRYTSSLMHHLK